MVCPTCDHTMQMIFNATNHKAWWCDRCGTMKDDRLGHVSEAAPKLVERCRTFGDALGPAWGNLWHRLGIAESINLPENRESKSS